MLKTSVAVVALITFASLQQAAANATEISERTVRVNVSTSGEQAREIDPYLYWLLVRPLALSGDGRVVAFSSSADNLVAGDTNGSQDVFVRDVATGVTERVSVSSEGVQASGESYEPAISWDGRFVAFISSAPDLVAGDTNQGMDVFVRDRALSITERVSVSDDEREVLGLLWSPSISADGSKVAFASLAADLVDGDLNGSGDVFVRDVVSRTTELVSIRPDRAPSVGINSWSRATLSADGEHVAFVDVFRSHSCEGFCDVEQVLVRDLRAGTTRAASVTPTGELAERGSSSGPALSADGQVVAFWSTATDLVTEPMPNRAIGLFVRDLRHEVTRRIAVDDSTARSVETPGGYTIVAFYGFGGGPELSADGRSVVFATIQGDLVEGDRNVATDVFSANVASGAIRRVSVSSGRREGDGHSYLPAVSGDGSAVAFVSTATNIVLPDAGAAPDVYLRAATPASCDGPPEHGVLSGAIRDAREALPAPPIVREVNCAIAAQGL